MRLSDIAEPRGEKWDPQAHPNEPFLGMDLVESHSMRILGFGRAGDMKSACARFEQHDVLYGRLRPYLNKVVLAPHAGLASAEFIVLPGSAALVSTFLAYRLNARDFVSFSSHLNEGDRPRVSFDQLDVFDVCLPHPVEQRAIVAKIEELFSELDQGKAQLEAVRRQLGRYRQSVLKAAFEGRLTAAWRERRRREAEAGGEPIPTAGALLDRIRAEREAAYKQRLAEWERAARDWEAAGAKASGRKQPRKPAKPKDSPPLAAEELADLPELPEGWVWCRTGSLLYEDMCSGISVKGSDSPPGVRALKLNAMSADGFDFDIIRYIEIDDDVAEHLAVQAGDLFVSRGNGSLDLVGRGTLAQAPADVTVFPDTMIRLRIVASLRGWMKRCWQSRRIRGQIESAAKTTAGIYKINQGDIARFTVPIAPLYEQAQIVNEIDARLSVVDQVERTIAAALKQAESLRQSILKKAFEGRLLSEAELTAVRADPAYEPAEQLLARIRSEAAEQPKRAASKKSRSKPAAAGIPKGERYRQAAIAAYAVMRLADLPTFGRTQQMKFLYLAPHLIERESHIHAQRQAAGPMDPAIYKVESLAAKNGWFTSRKSGKGVAYQPGPKIMDACAAAERMFGDHKDRVDWLLDHFANMNTEQAELLATTFAVWNDDLIDGHHPTDGQIVKGVHGWHPDKAKFTRERIRACIKWMREHDLVPTGKGRKTERVGGEE